MTFATYGEAFDTKTFGPSSQVVVPAAVHGIANSIPASSNVQSNLLASLGYKAIAVGAGSTQTGAVQVQRYLDAAGTMPQGSQISATFSGGVAVANITTDNLPFQSFKVTITNTGASSATLSNVTVLLQAQ